MLKRFEDVTQWSVPYALIFDQKALDFLPSESVAFDGVGPPSVQCAGPLPHSLWKTVKGGARQERITQTAQYAFIHN